MSTDYSNTFSQYSVIYSQANCIGCTAAKSILKQNGHIVEEKYLPEYKEELLTLVPNAKSVPQIFINNEYIGGLTELRKYLLK